VWYDGVPPGQQPAPMNCRDAERIASRDGRARVIYGNARGSQNDGGWQNDGRRDGSRPRAIPRGDARAYPYPGRYPNDRGAYGYGTVPFDNGYRDGYEKGREDGRDDDDFDPVRHGRYRSGDRGYDRRYGTKEEYRLIYRDGFEVGYDEGYRETNASRADRRRGDNGTWWPF
jgi:hypothetical protein